MTQRKFLTSEQKVSILRERLLEQAPVSELCKKHGISPINFYNWQKRFFENGATALERNPASESPDSAGLILVASQSPDGEACNEAEISEN